MFLDRCGRVHPEHQMPATEGDHVDAVHGTLPDHADDISGTTLDGRYVSDLEVIDLIRAGGSLTIVRGPAQRLQRGRWAEQFGALAQERGVHVSIRDTGRLVLVLDIGWEGWAPSPAIIDAHRMESSRAGHPSGRAGLRALPEPPT